MNILKWFKYKNIETHMDKIDNHLGSLSSTGIKGVPDLVYEIRLLLGKIADIIDENNPIKP